jgi:dolichol kinase
VSVPSEPEGRAQTGPASVGLSLKRELARKGLHLLSTTVPIAYADGVSRAFVVWGLFAGVAIALTVEATRGRYARARTLFGAGVGSLLREHERHGLSGATWLLIALLVAAVCFPRDVAIATMCAVSLGDAAAAIVGRTLAPSGSELRKSFAGTAACFTASAIGARAIAHIAWREALIVGVLASLAERPRRPLDDNLRIAVVVGCGILLWRMGFS